MFKLFALVFAAVLAIAAANPGAVSSYVAPAYSGYAHGYAAAPAYSGYAHGYAAAPVAYSAGYPYGYSGYNGAVHGYSAYNGVHGYSAYPHASGRYFY